jgi:hypothetical protein
MTIREKNQMELLTSAIALYLNAHPHAADSLEGIMQWWLPQQRNTVDITDLQQALDFMVNTGAVYRTTLIDGRMLYTSKEKDEIN